MNAKFLISLAILVSVGFLFQNCAEDFGSGLQTPSVAVQTQLNTEAEEDCVGEDCPNTSIVEACSFNDQMIQFGSTITAYHTSTVPYGSSCSSQAEDRTCGSTGLTGTASYATCQVNAAASCLLNGVSLAHGSSRTAYTRTTVSYGQSCNSVAVSVSCSNGQLSSSQTLYSSCTAGAPLVRWVNVSSSYEGHKQACQRAGLYPARNQGYGICASGENQPVQGAYYTSIQYPYGVWGGAGGQGSQLIWRTGYGSDVGPMYCYHAGQTRDMDGTDLVTAYLCSEEVNNQDTTPIYFFSPSSGGGGNGVTK